MAPKKANTSRKRKRRCPEAQPGPSSSGQQHDKQLPDSVLVCTRQKKINVNLSNEDGEGEQADADFDDYCLVIHL